MHKVFPHVNIKRSQVEPTIWGNISPSGWDISSREKGCSDAKKIIGTRGNHNHIALIQRRLAVHATEGFWRADDK